MQEERKTSCPNGQLLNSDKILKHRSLTGVRRTGSLSGDVAGNVVIPDAISEVDVPLKWSLSSQSLSQVLAFPRRKRKRKRKGRTFRAYTAHACFLGSSSDTLKISLLPKHPSRRALHCLWNIVLPNSWIAFPWIKDIKFITKSFYFYHLTAIIFRV